MRTTYLASAICTTLSETGTLSAVELLEELPRHYDGTTTLAEIERELDLLERSGSVSSIDYDGVTIWQDES